MSECVGGGVISGCGVSLNGEELGGMDGGISFDPSSATGDGDVDGLFDGGGE
jgi:hypothetical protein